MPLQHINDRLLKLMNRRHTREETEAIIARLRATIPGLVLRTTFIVGFPGETEAEFDELVEFVAATRFERLGAFTYSLEPDTPAAKLPGHLPAELIEERRDRLMAVQQPIAFAFNRGLVGRTLDVLIDCAVARGPAPLARPDLRRRSRRRRRRPGARRTLPARRHRRPARSWPPRATT